MQRAGALPADWGLVDWGDDHALSQLDLHGNAFSGPLPTKWTLPGNALSGLEVLDLTANRCDRPLASEQFISQALKH